MNWRFGRWVWFTRNHSFACFYKKRNILFDTEILKRMFPFLQKNDSFFCKTIPFGQIVIPFGQIVIPFGRIFIPCKKNHSFWSDMKRNAFLNLRNVSWCVRNVSLTTYLSGMIPYIPTETKECFLSFQLTKGMFLVQNFVTTNPRTIFLMRAATLRIASAGSA